MERRPLLAIGLAAAAGAVLLQPVDPIIRALSVCAALVLFALCVLRTRASGVHAAAWIALVCGASSAIVHGTWDRQTIRAHTTRVLCTVLDEEPSTETLSAYDCALDSGPTIEVFESAFPPAAASHVLLRGRLQSFDQPRNPGEPDLRAIEAERGVSAELMGARVLAFLPPARIDVPIAIARAHAWALRQLRRRLAEPYASIVAGELWGTKATLSPKLRAEFQETGTVHILVTAGLHLGVVALVIVSLLKALTVPRVYAAAIAVAAIWLFALFSGLHLPAVRAAMMLTFGLGAYAAGAASRSWNAYGAALVLLAVDRPASVVSASFALSLSCVGAILLLADELATLLEHIAFPEKVKEALILTLAAQIGTWPLTASIFLIVAPFALLANFLVVPAVGLTMMLAAAQLCAAWCGPLAQLFANANGWILAWIVNAVHAIATLPGAALTLRPPPPFAIAFYDVCVVLAVWCWRRGGRTPAAMAIVLGFAAIVAPPAVPQTRLRISVLDVGQADGIVIQTPAGHVLVVDAGGKLERGRALESSAEKAGERVVVPFLRRAGVTHIDALVLSHPHGDHVGAAAPILRDGFSVGELADGGQHYTGYAWRDAIATARADRVPVVYPRAGMVWRTDDGVTLTFIGPSLPFIESDNTINDNSIAFILRYKQFRMLFTGDAGVAAEQRFLSEAIDLHADVLKVGHHGSAYSSSPEFIAAVHPRYAIISVGRHNMFGHPAPSTLATLQRVGAQVYRTDQNGAVCVATDGQAETIAGMLP